MSVKRKLRVLVLSNVYPSKAQPVHGVFVKHRMMEVAKLCEIKIVSPIPFFPLVQMLPRYRFRNLVPKVEKHNGVDVFYPRYLSVPMILKPLDSVFMFLSLMLFIRRFRGEFDLIDAHFGYPDGFAAVLMGFLMRKPVVITLRGHDIFELPKHPVRIRQVVYALKRARIVFSVSAALKHGAVKLGVDEEKIHVISNGVDVERFRPILASEARKKTGLPQDKKIILSVGHLVERKGFQFIIDALSLMKTEDAMLVVCGGAGQEGDFLEELKRKTTELGVDVFFAGAVTNEKLSDWYNACDVFCLASAKEGWPNVVLEAMACGKPVVATRVWGTPEVLCSEKLGTLVDRQDGGLLAEALDAALRREWNSNYIREYACTHTWAHVARKVYEHFLKALEVEYVQ